jgi:hopanoid biosynthesis associated radical SAM protein HpnH
MGVPLSQMCTVASYVLKQKFSAHLPVQRIGRDEPSPTTALSQTTSISAPERKDSTYVLGQKSSRRKGRKRYPLVLMLEPLFRCNLACAGCGKIQYPAHVLKQQLTPEECFRAVDECGAPMVSIPGGEPLMHPQIAEIVEGLVARKKYIYLCTNALLLKEKLDLFKPSKYLTFSVHLDGQREHHDFSVCREGGYDIAVDAMREAIRRGFRVTTNTTLFDGADPNSVRSFFDAMMDLGVEGMMLSPGYSYDKAPDQQHFLGRARTRRLFRAMLSNRRKRWVFNQSPLFLEFLMGKRDYPCTPWGMPTYNIFGWQKPCYLLQDGYADTFQELMESTDWDKYGTESGNPKCANCMVHSGYEASAVNDTFASWNGFWATVRATFSTQYKDEQALAMLKEEVRPVHSYNPLVQISGPTLSPTESESMGHPELEGSRA